MYGDSVILIGSTQARAFGNVTLQQGDSLAAFSDRLNYDAQTEEADLRGNVALRRGKTELYTERLDYNLRTQLAEYHTGGRIVTDSTQLRSTHGYYYAGRGEVFFRDSVVVVDDRFEMRADTLRYDLINERVYFLGPTVIRTDTHRIYTEAGYYDVGLNEAVFSQNAQYESGERRAAADTIRYRGRDEVYVLEGDAYVAEGDFQRATADRIDFYRRRDAYQLRGNATLVDSTQTVTGEEIDYDGRTERIDIRGGRPRVSAPPMIVVADNFATDEKTGANVATGDVIWQDTSADLTIEAARANYDRQTGYLKATGGTFGRPLLTTLLEGDTMYLAADTLESIQHRDRAGRDSIRTLAAFRDVRILKSDLQAVADSMSFNTVDSVLTLYEDPVLWQDTSQLTGDTVQILFKNGELDRVRLDRNAMVLTSTDFVFFNQVGGKRIEAFFDSSALVRTEVIGNAEAVYYIQDEAGLYVGVNKTACSRMILGFRGGAVQNIRFLAAPSGKMDPMTAVDHEEIKLDGVRWRSTRRPSVLSDLFGPRPLAPALPTLE